MQHIAKEGRCFVISVNQFCKVSDFPSDYPPFTPEHHDRKPDGSRWETGDILSRGGSCVVGPLGTFISEPVWDKEKMILATLKKSDIVESRYFGLTAVRPAQMDFDPVGSYSRPDIFSLTVNKKPAVNVTFEEA
ncbi:nitrilase [Penicillium expansum]|nr:nitrilase [Penicillium expansum]